MGAQYSSCKQAYPSPISGPQCWPWRPQGPRPPCPRTGPRPPSSPHSWAVWDLHWGSSSERTAFPSFQSTRCHWLREGVRGSFSGSCTSRPGGKGSAQPAPSGGLPALDPPTGPPPSATVRPSTIPSAWNAVPHIYQHDPLLPPSLCSDFTSLPRPTCGTLINCTPPRADLLFPRALPLPNMLGGLNHDVPESKTPTDFKDSYEKII